MHSQPAEQGISQPETQPDRCHPSNQEPEQHKDSDAGTDVSPPAVLQPEVQSAWDVGGKKKKQKVVKNGKVKVPGRARGPFGLVKRPGQKPQKCNGLFFARDKKTGRRVQPGRHQSEEKFHMQIQAVQGRR